MSACCRCGTTLAAVTHICPPITSPPLQKSDLTAILIALDELESYHGVMGNTDDADYKEFQKHKWTIKKLRALLTREGLKTA